MVFDFFEPATSLSASLTDFKTAHLNGPELTALVSAWQAGAISPDTLLHNLRQGSTETRILKAAKEAKD